MLKLQFPWPLLTSSWVRLIGNPYLIAVQLAGHKGKLEIARHDSDDLVGPAVKLDGCAESGLSRSGS